MTSASRGRVVVAFLAGVGLVPLLSARTAPEVEALRALETRVAAVEGRAGGGTGPAAAESPGGGDAALRVRLSRLEGLLRSRDSVVARRTPAGVPVDGGVVTSGMSPARLHPILRVVMPHRGVDLAAPDGTPVRATADGRVSYRFTNATYGRGMDLDHGEGTFTRYAHLSGWAVKAGDVVKRGQVVGWVGSTGRATGPHLHYEVFIRYQRIDPAATFPADVRVAEEAYGPGDS